MRPDAIGLFWQDEKRPVIQRVREMPPVPNTGWVRPHEYPNLAAAKQLSIDVETWDPQLADFKDGFGETVTGKGPGWGRGFGHIVGLSVGTEDGRGWYFPMRHEVEPEWNLDPSHVLHWAKEQLGRTHQPKIGANLLYDFGWLAHEGVHIAGELVDVQFAEALLEERGTVNLEYLGRKYLNEGKDSSYLYQWAAAYYGGEPTGKQRANIYRCPPRLVGPYAESDATLPHRVIAAQWPLLERQGLVELFRMECGLIPLLVRMRMQGVSVDVHKAERLRFELLTLEKELQARLDWQAGNQVNVNAAATIAQAFDRHNIPYGKTKTGQPSFTKNYLESLADVPMVSTILELRKVSKLRGTFMENAILDSQVNGKIYCQFHPMRADDGGTRSGRFSSSDPNLQQVPSRDEELAPKVRGVFIPHAGHLQWRKYDYSQIEYRELANWAVGPGSNELRAKFINDPKTDYHIFTQELVNLITGISWPRKPIKNINFGIIFGMGLGKLARSLGLSAEKAEELLNGYHEACPFAKATMEACANEIHQTGFITTTMGRRSRFDLWEPRYWPEDEERGMPLPYVAACETWGAQGLKRSMTHKGLNRRLQGSAADRMKAAMLRCYREGVFEVTGYPTLTVHDELDFSDPGGVDSAFDYMQHVMESALPSRVPIVAECDKGPNWGEAK